MRDMLEVGGLLGYVHASRHSMVEKGPGLVNREAVHPRGPFVCVVVGNTCADGRTG